MCSTCYALGVVGIFLYSSLFLYQLWLIDRLGDWGGEGKIILRRAINRNVSEYFRVPQDGVTLNSQNGNRP